jgi:tRNA A-37 threonylcarbamoyl transferase component Bud32
MGTPAGGQQIGHFELLEKLGAGGMGVVYKARDTHLNRLVAIKVIQPARVTDSALQARLLAEARAASALNHPNVVTVYDAGSCDGVDFIAMEYVPGETLGRRIPPQGMPVAEALAAARGVAAALAAAHAAGIVHRDLKPGNVMIRPDGVVKVMDFGLAKALTPPPGDEEATRTAHAVGDTAPGTVLGTGPYMSPEQAEGKPVDARSDIFSFGAMLFEMLSGRAAFHGDTYISTISAVLKDTPPPVHGLRPDVPAEFDGILRRCLAKNREDRFASGAELGEALDALTPKGAPTGSRRAKVAAIAAAAIVVIAVAAWWGVRQSRTRWVYEQAIPELYRLAADQKFVEAFELGQRVRATLPGDPAVELALSRLGWARDFKSQPPGADIYYRRYLEPGSPERLLGRTPVHLTFPRALLRVRVVKKGFEDSEGSLEPSSDRWEFTLYAKGSHPEGMVDVPAGRRTINGESVELPGFWLDKFEVTNREFKAFVDQGGYRKRELWKHPFVKDGREISWEEAMRGFVDGTGRPGPALWELGSYPENQAQFPVGGVSWYEAAAYAAFAGKSLPSVAHWQRAAGQGQFSEILKLSNFGGRGAAPVGQHQGIGPFGTYDMAGNVREWCFNAVGSRRAILGGGWDEPAYRFVDFQARDPLERLAADGFRCAVFRTPPPAAALGRMDRPERDPTKEKPAGDETFRAWRNTYAYDASALNAKVEAVDDSSEYYRKEKITMAAAYGSERFTAWVFIPRNSQPPYQTVVYSPSAEAQALPDSGWLGPQRQLLFVIRSGRALLYPVYQGTYERERPSAGPNALRELLIERVQDMSRSIDYLATRQEFDLSRLAYYGISMGCRQGVSAVPLEPRIRAAILVACGIPPSRYPDGTDPLDFAPRFKVPVLLINGRDDFTYPYNTSQLPLFQLLGTPEKDKQMIMHEGGHISDLTPELLHTALDWLDRYLGPVNERR